jgi:Ca-activated chloride channel family protein
MWRSLPVLLVLLAVSPIQAAGLLVPTEKKVPPLAMLEHHVSIKMEDQVAITRVEQTFRNHTDRQLEATYIFPVPKGASVQKFTMWVNGEEVRGELVEAAKARKIYEDIVLRTQDPGLLEYIDQNLLKVRVFPVPANGEQKLSFQYLSVASADHEVVHYVYPLKTDGKAVETLKKYSINVDMKSQHPLQNIYSPTHSIKITRNNDKQASIAFEKDQGTLDRNFELYYTASSKDVGLTTIVHRPVQDLPGYVMLLISPRAELAREQQVPRDVVFVLDTSGSMRGKRIDQARSALKYCLKNLRKEDRFSVMHFSTTINEYADKLLPAESGHVQLACNWVDGLFASGGTAINQALMSALEKRASDETRNFTIVFFTDGQPTVGETNPTTILKNVMARNTGNTRIFSFGVGDDVNATMLDQMAENTRAVTTYVRESEDIEDRVSSLYSKISNPVLTNLKLSVGSGIQLSEVYPPQLPDLFHGSQLVVLGRFNGNGHAAITLSGNVGKETKEFVYECDFPEKVAVPKPFVEDLWARRKVGYILDQIRINGEKQELVDEVITLSKRYGITTPYTSYLIVPDAPTPVASEGRKDPGKANVNQNSAVPDVAFRLKVGDDLNSPPPGNVPPRDAGTPQPKFGTSVPPVTTGSTTGTGPLPGFAGGGFNGGFGGGSFGGGFGGPIAGMPANPYQPFGNYYQNHGYKGDDKRIQFAPAIIGPSMTWAVPNSLTPAPQPTSPVVPTSAPTTVRELAQLVQTQGGVAKNRGVFEDNLFTESETAGKDKGGGDKSSEKKPFGDAKRQKIALDQAKQLVSQQQLGRVQSGQLGVDLSVINDGLRNQSQLLQKSAIKRIQNRNCIELGGIWIDEGFDPNMTTITIKALSPAYFQLLERHPEVKDFFQLGNHLVWVTPRGVALIVDTAEGREVLSDREMDLMFLVAKQ